MVGYDYRWVNAKNTTPFPPSCEGVLPDYPHPDLISDKKVSFFTPISQTWTLKNCHHYLD